MIFLTIESDFRGIKVTKNGLIPNHKNEQFLVKLSAVSGLKDIIAVARVTVSETVAPPNLKSFLKFDI